MAGDLITPDKDVRELTAQARKSWQALKRGEEFLHWVDIGKAIDAFRHQLFRELRINEPRGQHYKVEMGEFLRENGWSNPEKGREGIADSVRTNLQHVVDNLPAVQQWRATLPLGTAQRTNHPNTVWRAFPFKPISSQDEPHEAAPDDDKNFVTLAQWRELAESDRAALLARVGTKGLNRQNNRDIEWAHWSCNPVTGCLHGCSYCYARDIAVHIYPAEVGFAPTLWPDRLNALSLQKPSAATGDPVEDMANRNVFVCSMADLFGRWVPDEWISAILSKAAANPQWNLLFLTKFPQRMAEFEIPPNAWLGTSVDCQARVANAERAFQKIIASVKWLSIEPFLEPLRFNKLHLFDWLVIGGASPSRATDGTPATPEWNPPIEWIVDLHAQAQAAGCKVYYKTNIGLSDMTRCREYPTIATVTREAPAEFNYLREVG